MRTRVLVGGRGVQDVRWSRGGGEQPGRLDSRAQGEDRRLRRCGGAWWLRGSTRDGRRRSGARRAAMWGLATRASSACDGLGKCRTKPQVRPWGTSGCGRATGRRFLHERGRGGPSTAGARGGDLGVLDAKPTGRDHRKAADAPLRDRWADDVDCAGWGSEGRSRARTPLGR